MGTSETLMIGPRAGRPTLEGATYLVTRRDRSRVILVRPSVEGDSLRGTHRGKQSAIALPDVSSVMVEHTSAVGAVLGFVIIGGMIALAVGASSFTILGN